MDKATKKVITSRIKALRNKHGFTQHEMAEKLGLEHNSYAKMESGSNIPSVKILMRISEIFNVSVDLILFGNDSKREINVSLNEKVLNYLDMLDVRKLETVISELQNLHTIAKYKEDEENN